MKATLVMMLSAVLFVVPSCKPKETPTAAIGNKAPSFTLKDTNGKTVSLSDFSGKVVIIDFWTTWCPPCKESSKELEKLHRKYGERDVVVLGVSMDSGSGAAQKVMDFAGRHSLTYRMLLDDGKASESYAVRSIPVTYVLDKKHIIVNIHTGYMPGMGERIAGQIEKLL